MQQFREKLKNGSKNLGVQKRPMYPYLETMWIFILKKAHSLLNVY